MLKINRTCSYQHHQGKLTSGSKEKRNSSSNNMFVSSLCKKYLSFRCRFFMDLGHNLNLREKYEKLVRKNGDIIFLQVKYFQKTVQPVAKN